MRYQWGVLIGTLMNAWRSTNHVPDAIIDFMKKLLSALSPKKLVYAAIILVPILFRRAFSIYYFGDDFAFLNSSRIQSFPEFLQFFNPIRDTFYRPLSSEFFYFLHHVGSYNLFLFHSIVMAIFTVGLVWMYNLFLRIHFKPWLAALVVSMYAINFTHVFQIYWFATFQEVLMFAALVGALLYATKNAPMISLALFACALLSKETAIMFLPLSFFILYLQDNNGKFDRSLTSISQKATKVFLKNKVLLGSATAMTVLAFLIYSAGLSSTSELPQYTIRLSPRLFLDTAYWYSLWSFGFPSFLPDYMSRMIALPHKEFWNNFIRPHTLMYIYSLLGYICILILGSIHALLNKKSRMPFIAVTILSGALFFGTLFPSLLISHKWMVRLTVPLVASIAVQSYILYMMNIDKNRLIQVIGRAGILLYILMNLGGIPLHENTSTYNLENSLTRNAHAVFSSIPPAQREPGTKTFLFIEDNEEVTNSAWGGSEKLKTTFSNQNFIDHYFGARAQERLTVIYDFEADPPPGAVIIQSRAFFK